LMQNSYPPAVIRNEKREEYYRALMAADEGEISHFVELVAREVEATIQTMIEIVQHSSECSRHNVAEQLSRFDVSLRREREQREQD
ncbi:hypothetical protein FJY63_07085, partial [Candidatus Sumerlaeota bacterium]|nr:hypothetical protein [Candidatus Sumerlaeota bacterium]